MINRLFGSLQPKLQKAPRRCRSKKCSHGRQLRLETLETRNVLTLLGVAPLDLPTIAYNSGGTVSYDSDTDLFAISATPLSIETDSSSGLFFSGALNVNILVDGTGALIGGTPDDDLILTGDVDVDGDFIVDYSGVLLTAEVLGFGSEDSGGSTDLYDYKFSITGGLLASFYAGMDLGVTTTSEMSNFAGDFTVDFGGNAKGSIGGVEQEDDDPASLSGVKYTDITGDGISGDDTPLSGVTINLYQDTGTIGVLDGEVVFQTDITDVNGEYSFADLPAGDYIVEEIVPVGYAATTPIFYALSLAAGENVATGFDFANAELGSIGGVKFAEITECECDKHGNTTEETVIETLAGVTINLYLDNGTTPGVLDGGDTFVDSDVTDGDGEYLFEDLLPGAYLVQEIVPAGYMALTPIVVGVNLTSGSDVPNANFLNKLVKASVGNYFFIDSDSNGLQNLGDFGVNGVTVKLLNQFGSVIETTVTANDGSGNAGYYLFYDLNAGNYMIEFVVPEGVQFTIKDVGANANNTLDSDVNSNGRTDVFSLVANQHRRDIDAGVKPEVCVETVVYKVKDYFDKCQQSKAGTIKGVTLEYNDTNEELLVQVTMATYQGRLADGFTIVIDDGSSIGDKAGTHAIFYFDATGANPILNVFGHNGKNDGSSIKDSNGYTSSYDPDKIATSVDNSTGWVKELSVVKSSSKTVFTFRVDVGAINDNSPVFSKINWQGSEIGKYASFVLDTYDGLTTKYDSSGFLTKWSFCYHGWADACQIKTQKCIVKETIAIDEFFEEWGWEVSAFTGDSDGDPLADILWAGSADACQADKDCNKCDDDDDHHGGNNCDWDWFKMFSCKISTRC